MIPKHLDPQAEELHLAHSNISYGYHVETLQEIIKWGTPEQTCISTHMAGHDDIATTI